MTNKEPQRRARPIRSGESDGAQCNVCPTRNTEPTKSISLIIGVKGGVQTISHVLVSKTNGLDNPPFNAPSKPTESIECIGATNTNRIGKKNGLQYAIMKM